MRLMLAPASAGNPFPRDAYIIWSLAPGLTYEVEASTDLQQWHRIPGPYYLYGKENNRWNLLTQVQAASLMSFYRVRVKESACE
jgi:hypothetical protein